mgnify:CR=1 FL=1
MNEVILKKQITDEDIRKLVIARLRMLSSGKKLSIGSDGEFTKEELIKSVEADDQIGKKITEIQLHYLRSLKEGLFFNE